MSFLKKLGGIAVAASGAIPVFGPIIGAIIPKAAPTIENVNDELNAIAGVIVQMEVVGQVLSLPGAKKLEIAVPLVAQIILAAPLMRGKKIKDQAMFMKGVTQVAGGMADILNAFDEVSV